MKFVEKLQSIEALQWDGSDDSSSKILEFGLEHRGIRNVAVQIEFYALTPHEDAGDHTPEIHQGSVLTFNRERDLQMRPNDWIVFYPTGGVEIIDPETFSRKYGPARSRKKASDG